MTINVSLNNEIFEQVIYSREDEFELQNHDFFKHIFPQITRFFAFYKDSKQRHNSFSESRQHTWGGNKPSCAVNIYDTDHWDEIQKLIEQLVKKYQEA